MEFEAEKVRGNCSDINFNPLDTDIEFNIVNCTLFYDLYRASNFQRESTALPLYQHDHCLPSITIK